MGGAFTIKTDKVAISEWAVGASTKLDDVSSAGISVNGTANFRELSGLTLYSFNKTNFADVAGQVDYDWKNKSVTVQGAAIHTLDDNTEIRAKLNNKGVITTALKHKVGQNLTLTVSDEFDVSQLKINHNGPLPFGVAFEIAL